ncbi:MAG: DUF1905 domain-containing protein [Novosphingobium sp.]
MNGESFTLTAPLKVMRGSEGMESAYLEFAGEQAGLIVAEKLAVQAAGAKLRFGSFKVVATIGATRWDSSLYPEKDGAWFLPVRKPVRLAEGLAEGNEVTVRIEVTA